MVTCSPASVPYWARVPVTEFRKSLRRILNDRPFTFTVKYSTPLIRLKPGLVEGFLTSLALSKFSSVPAVLTEL